VYVLAVGWTVAGLFHNVGVLAICNYRPGSRADFVEKLPVIMEAWVQTDRGPTSPVNLLPAENGKNGSLYFRLECGLHHSVGCHHCQFLLLVGPLSVGGSMVEELFRQSVCVHSGKKQNKKNKNLFFFNCGGVKVTVGKIRLALRMIPRTPICLAVYQNNRGFLGSVYSTSLKCGLSGPTRKGVAARCISSCANQRSICC
jgi:hypothetical protein